MDPVNVIQGAAAYALMAAIGRAPIAPADPKVLVLALLGRTLGLFLSLGQDYPSGSILQEPEA
jgi:hypothetical protein